MLLDGGPLPFIPCLISGEIRRTRTVLVATITNVIVLTSLQKKRIKRENDSTRLRHASLPQIVGAQDPGVLVLK